jgi:hypothetical protein
LAYFRVGGNFIGHTMNCIFCKEISDNTKSVEHIIPESLGNKSHTLDRGIVCDKCNNYFALKIEKEVLELPYFKSLRHRNYILNKKNRLPTENGFILHPNGGQVDIIQKVGNIIEVNVNDKDIFNLISEGKVDKLIIPILPSPPTDNLFISRLLGKIALEALAQRVGQVENWNQDFIEHKDLDDLRNYVRYGKGDFWVYNVRTVYNEIDTLKGTEEDPYDKRFQILHEFDFLYIDNKYLYFVCIIMGIEYAINMGQRVLDQYKDWLKNNDEKSPLSDEIQSRKTAANIGANSGSGR